MIEPLALNHAVADHSRSGGNETDFYIGNDAARGIGELRSVHILVTAALKKHRSRTFLQT
jgi:hypothetical protein